ncbi:integral membrane sensor signal transduction histidine kinase [Calothrix parasitica NIES-267]|uniref:histidine kinase n=1 Tax=Calothrix parasitica NIES-267 TaxID=1973488 RepID=A0A1Z4LN51_9CYAN|nr:integral membrane sensor signal transduction histidine kinase [Calothrix parasitica NIES-267]
MKLSSFRLRIALFSSFLAGSALIGFGAVSWWQIYNANISRLDAQIINELMRGNGPPKRDVTVLYQKQRWKLYSNSVSDILGANTKIPTGLLVLDAEGNKLYQSQQTIVDKDLHRLLAKQITLTKPLRLISVRKLSSQELPPPPLPILLTTKSTETGTWRIGTAKFRKIQLAVAVNLEVVNQEMATITNIFLISIPGILLLIAVGAWLLSGSVLRPVNQLTNEIKQVSVKGLDRRISIDKIDIEFLELIRVFNLMLERLERSFHQASRFSGDAAHELKTPLTILQGELERTLQQVNPGSEVQQRLGYLLDEVHRLNGIIRKLLLLSLADAGKLSLYLVEVDISELLFQMLEDVEMLAPHLSVQTNIVKGLKVKGDKDLLMQVLQNLFSNAIKYNLTDGWIKVDAFAKNSLLKITIINASEGIKDENRTRIFDRFHRGDPSRNRKVEGIGLGLSLAREIVRAHNGELMLDSASEGETSFSLCLPIL